jgi:hypothetical protein
MYIRFTLQQMGQRRGGFKGQCEGYLHFFEKAMIWGDLPHGRSIVVAGHLYLQSGTGIVAAVGF